MRRRRDDESRDGMLVLVLGLFVMLVMVRFLWELLSP